MLQLHEGAFCFRAPPSQMVTIPVECHDRSKLLCNLAESTDTEVELPVSAAALLPWLHHLQSSAALPDGTAQGQGAARIGSADSGDSNEDLPAADTSAARQGAAQKHRGAAVAIHERSLNALRSMQAGGLCKLIMVRNHRCCPPVHMSHERCTLMRSSMHDAYACARPRPECVVHACARLKV